MTLNEYQEEIKKFCKADQDPRDTILMCAVGMSGEVGEVNELIKKSVFHGKPFQVYPDLLLELGDVLWYLSTMARMYGVTMEDVAQANVVKLNERNRIAAEKLKGPSAC